jgi:predicted membrane channel-forming protein YqfA (hemolysin III family)
MHRCISAARSTAVTTYYFAALLLLYLARALLLLYLACRLRSSPTRTTAVTTYYFAALLLLYYCFTSHAIAGRERMERDGCNGFSSYRRFSYSFVTCFSSRCTQPPTDVTDGQAVGSIILRLS